MNFITTYKGDFVWPDCKSINDPPHHGKKGRHPKVEVKAKCTNEKCECILSGKAPKAQGGEKEGEGASEGSDWSRTGPMGPLIDAKLFPAKRPTIGEPTLETFAATDKDHLKSTYQADFTAEAVYKQPSILKTVQAEYVNPRSAKNICHPPIRKFDRSCTSDFVPKVIDLSAFKLEGGSGNTPAISPYGRTEYQDFVSRLGGRIMQEKLIKPLKKKNFWK